MPTSVTTPDRRISSITVRVVLFRWRPWADPAARAVDAVSAALRLPSLTPLAFAALQRCLRPLRDPARFIFGNGCQNVERKLRRERLINRHEVNAQRPSGSR